MADVFASSAHAPAVIVQALAVDQASVARPVLEYSPLLIDADLVDIVATGNSEVQCAIARRTKLPASVCAAIAEVGTAAAALGLIANASAKLERFRIAASSSGTAIPGNPRKDADDGRFAVRDPACAGCKAVGHADAVRGGAQLAQRRSRRPRCEGDSRPLDRQYRSAVARRRHARTGAASPRHRTAYCRIDPARAGCRRI